MQTDKQQQGAYCEQRALKYLQQQGMHLLESNFHCKAGEIDLIMRDGEEVVFVEVRQRADRDHGGAAWSITPAKQRRIVRSAQFYLLRYQPLPPCRIDVVAIDGSGLEWIKNAITAD